MIITNILCIDWLIFIIGWLIHLICCSTCPIIDWLTLSTDISTCHATWAGSMATLLGSIATWLATFFALISIHLAYKAFRGQVNASRRASFDATFTQIFAQHNTLPEDKSMHHVGLHSMLHLLKYLHNTIHFVQEL